jgi:chorismate mutase/prephenate dehydratase
MKKDMNTIRKEIDSIDDEIIEILNKRCELSVEMGRLKQENNKEPLDPSRETAILKRLTSLARPPLTRAMIEKIFIDIFSISRSLQKSKKIAFLGPEGSYSHQATCSVFPFDSGLIALKDIESVIQEVATGRVDLGVVPVENSSEGMINLTLDMMATSRLYINREILLPIRNCLLSNTAMDKIDKVFSHPQPLAQCRRWIMDNLPGARTIETASTSDAALAASENKGSAAIASALSAEIYKLNILCENINDLTENITRFWVISRTMIHMEGRAKTSIIVTLENKPGSLYNALGIFAKKGINLTKIESRPSKKNPWEYLFFIDFQGNLGDDNVKDAMDEIKSYIRDIIVLGSYPEGRPLD